MPQDLPADVRLPRPHALEEGLARSGRKWGELKIQAGCQVHLTHDVKAALDAQKPFVALYVGGMGSREKNFYNQLVRRYGFDDAAQEIQDLYLEGKKDEAMAAIPDDLIDTAMLVLRPEVAALSMSGSSVIVAVNALMLKRLRLPAPLEPSGGRLYFDGRPASFARSRSRRASPWRTTSASTGRARLAGRSGYRRDRENGPDPDRHRRA